MANAFSKTTGIGLDGLASVPGLKSFSTARTAGGLEGAAAYKQEKLAKFADRLGENKDKRKLNYPETPNRPDSLKRLDQ